MNSDVRKGVKFIIPSSGNLGFRVVPIWSYGENVLNLKNISVLTQKKSALLLCIVPIMCMHNCSDNVKAIDKN